MEEDYKKEELLENFVSKNLSSNYNKRIQEIKSEIDFKHCFRAREDKVNWIVQVPSEIYSELISKEKIYMMWRIYRVKEFLNTVRCFKCHAHGHIAKYCSSPDQLCETCGSKEHKREDCPKKDSPVCVNCFKTKRKEINHNVKDKKCPEYQKYLEIYKAKIKWS